MREGTGVDFWDGFWPGLWSNGIATLIGVAVGIPIALAVDRAVRKQTRTAQVLADAEHLDRTLDAIGAAIAGNVPGIQNLANTVAKKEVPLFVNLNSAVWEAVRIDAVRLLHDPQLQVRLATYFEDLGELARLQIHLINTLTGIEASLGGIEEVRKKIFEILGSATAGLLDTSHKLMAEIAERQITGTSK